MAQRTWTLRTTIILLATAPLAISAVAIAYLVREQSSALYTRQIEIVERDWMRAKRAELVNYMNLALTSIGPIYHGAEPDDAAAQAHVKRVINRLTYGQDGYFFIYDYQGNNLVHPKQSFRVGDNWIDLQDPNGDQVIRNLIEVARSGDGFHKYVWDKPSAGRVADKIAYAVALDKWGWMIGTGLYLDDIAGQLDRVRAEVDQGIEETFFLIFKVMIACVGLVAATGLLITLRERRMADAQLRALTSRIIETQEEERGRIARELHDGISQILVSARFALEKAQLVSDAGGQPLRDTLERGVERVRLAMREVRRISRALRPSQLDDLGLSAAIENLVEEFGRRTGVETAFETAAVRNLLSNDAKTALFRIAQEALTNIERHAAATRVEVLIVGRGGTFTMTIRDDGAGLSGADGSGAALEAGLGLRNMRERMAQLGGELHIFDRAARSPGAHGVEIVATAPRSHVLTADAPARPVREEAHV
ncbi:MAG: cache domain-containing protein [Pseudomonadota bacterium]